MSIDIGIGVSSHADVRTAGCQAAEQMLEHLAGQKLDATLVFSSLRFADARMLKGVRSVTGNAPLVGCTDAGGIITAGPMRRSVTVVGMAIKGGYALLGAARHIRQNARAAGVSLANLFKKQNMTGARGLLMFPDGLSSNVNEILRGVQKVLGRHLPVVGGSAADDFYFQRTFQYFNDEVLTDSVPALMLCGDIAVGLGVRHGWVPLGRPRHVTRSAGHVIYQLDRRPAVSIYEDFLGLNQQELTQEPMANVAMTYPLGTPVKGQAEYLLRGAIRVGRAGSLICTGDMPEGSSVQLMIGGYESALEAAQQAACEAVEQIGPRRLSGALIFCSVARQKMLGSEFQGEIDVIRDALGGSGVRMGGFYTYGEIAPASPSRRTGAASTAERNTFHNESVVVMALG